MKSPEKAVSIDEYIRIQSLDFTAVELRGLRRFAVALDEKKNAAEAQGHGDLKRGIEVLAGVLASSAVDDAADPLPRHLAETGVALRYVIKGVDIIPDFVPELGLADDAWIVARVLQRNPELTETTH